jgi:hypothetical protein
VFSPSYPDNQPVPTPDVLAVYAEAGVTWWLENGTTLDQTRGRAREGPPTLGLSTAKLRSPLVAN